MKRLLLALVAALALPTAVNANWFGKYNSKAEAWEACNKWKNKQISYSSIDISNKNKRYSNLNKQYEKIKASNSFLDNEKKRLAKRNLESIEQINMRYCSEERETKQILGYGVKAIKNDIIYYSRDLLTNKKLRSYKILQYFKY